MSMPLKTHRLPFRRYPCMSYRAMPLLLLMLLVQTSLHVCQALGIAVNAGAPTQTATGDVAKDGVGESAEGAAESGDNGVTKVGGDKAVWIPRVVVSVLLGLLLVLIVGSVAARLVGRRRRDKAQRLRDGSPEVDGVSEVFEAAHPVAEASH